MSPSKRSTTDPALYTILESNNDPRRLAPATTSNWFFQPSLPNRCSNRYFFFPLLKAVVDIQS
jgi:hypothetical protein